jgi:ParB/RepB/Spo0J family partition protein
MADVDQPRKTFGKKEMDELKASIRRRGLIMPLSVTPSGRPPHEPQFVVTAGERRLRALAELVQHEGAADLRRVPCVIARVDGPDKFLHALDENMVRQDLTALEVSECVRRIRAEYGWTYARIAEELGRDETWVAQRVGIAERLCPAARDLLIDCQRKARGDESGALDDESAVDPTFTLLRSVSSLLPDQQVGAIRGVIDGQLRGNRAVAYVTAHAPSTMRHETRGRPRKAFQVRAPDDVSLPAEKQSITLQHGGNTTVVARTVVDLRDTNLAAFFRHLERRLGWKMEAEDFLGAIEQALAADRAALVQFQPEECRAP